ncbi:MAG: hypothetical protein NT028_08945 [candidate division Zixibacteria bacterium]|nr:hypothetical protein [candidate division Zixibacteria bacterium]
MKSKLLAALVVITVVLATAVPARCDVPSLISYQGRLTDVVGTPLDTTLGLVFTVYADGGGITSLWTETQPAVSIKDGLFQVLLGSVKPIDMSIFSGEERWLKVQIQGGPAITTLIPIVSVAYAHRAVQADTAEYALSSSSGGSGSGWTDDGAAVRLTTITDNVGIGTSSPNARLEVKNSGNTGLAALIRNDNQANSSNPALWVETSGDAAAVLGVSPHKYGLHGSSANSYGVYGTGSKGVYGYHIDSRHYGFLGSGNFGVFGKDSTTGVWGAIGGGNAGVVGVGQGISQVGVFGENSSGGVGIRGSSIDSSGIYGSSASKYGVYGTGSKGVFGFHPGTNHYGFLGSQNFGVFGKDSTTGLWGAIGGGNAGVYGEAQATSHIGVFGVNGGGGVGVRGSSIDSCGIYGSSAREFGVLGTGVRGIYGLYLTNGNFGYLGSSDYGVYGEYKDNANYGYLGGQQAGVEGYSAIHAGVVGGSSGGIGVYGSSTEASGVYAYSFHGSAIHAQTTVGGGGLAGLFEGPVQINCTYDCDTTVLRLDGKALFSQNDGELALSTPTQGDAGRYRLKFDNNSLAVICGSDYDNQYFSFMSAWGANRKYDAHLKVHGSATGTGSWGKYIELYHDGTDGHITTDAGHIIISPASYVGIGTPTPAYKLDVAGTCHASSFPTSSASSRRKWKNNFRSW